MSLLRDLCGNIGPSFLPCAPTSATMLVEAVLLLTAVSITSKLNQASSRAFRNKCTLGAIDDDDV